MGRPPICTCGTIDLWVGQREQPAHQPDAGRLVQPQPHRPRLPVLCGACALVARRWPVERRFLVALTIEAAWEMIENTPMIIDRYREATAALGYTGDSVLNSLSDIAMMALGFLLARRLPVWASDRHRAGARTGAAARHPRQSDAQRLDAAGAERCHSRRGRRAPSFGAIAAACIRNDGSRELDCENIGLGAVGTCSLAAHRDARACRRDLRRPLRP